MRLPRCCTSKELDAPQEGTDDQDPPDMLVLSDMDMPTARCMNARQLTPSPTWDKESGEAPFAGNSLPVLASPSGRSAIERFDITPPSEAAQQANAHALVLANRLRPIAGFVRGM